MRHRGFIPWDEDIDIAMTRPQYGRFITLWQQEEHGGLTLQNYRTDPTCRHTLTRVLIPGTAVLHDGTRNISPAHPQLFVDVFPLDAVPEDEGEQAAQRARLLRLKTLLGYKINVVSPSPLKHAVKRLRRALLRVVSFRSILAKFDAVARQYETETPTMLCSMSSQYDYYKQRMPYDYYGTPLPMTFGGAPLLAPARPEAYLTQLYGDYMTLPPEEKQVFHVRVQATDNTQG